ncbi:MAG: tetratricopeptide repeat protein [Candidatus Zixiibacteriota bacterium]
MRLITFISLSLALIFLLSGCTKEERQLKASIPHYEAALKLQQQKDYEEALEELETAISIHPEFIDAHILRQKLKAKQVPEDILIREYEKLMKDNRKSPAYHFLYGRLLPSPDEQQIQYETSIELDPNFAWGYFGLGWVEYQKKKFNKAKEYFSRAVKLDPDKALFRNNLGGVKFYLGEHDDAIEELNQAREISSTFARPYANLASAYYQRGDFDSAIRMLQHYLNLAPNAHDNEDLGSKLIQLRGR